MKQGISLPELAAEVRRQQTMKRDFVANTTAVSVNHAGQVMFSVEDKPELFTPTRPAMRQMGEHCGIPAKYFDRMASEAPELLANNINYWFQKKPSYHMVRTLDRNMRAFLGRRYRPLDNADCVAASIPTIERFGGQVESCSLTPTKMYLKVVIPNREVELKADGVEWGKGHNPIHVLRPGLVISNSETGHGSVSIQPGVHERHCSNLMVMSDAAMRKFHVQKAVEDTDGVNTYVTDETRRKQDEAFWATVQDLVVAALDGRIFEDYVNQIRATMNQKIERPQATVELVADKFGLTNDERDSVLDRLIHSGEPTRFGLQAAITRMAQDVESYDRSTDLERLGGRIIELPKTDWETLAAAA
jgi:hypothetical protein